MTQLLVKTIADFSTTLTTKTAIGATTGTLTTGLDSDGVQLPTGTYGFTIDRSSSSKEHFTATLTGANLTDIKTVTRGTGVGTAGLLREHRKGAEVIITDHVAIKRMMNVLDGTTSFDSATPLGYDGTATISTANQLATKAYVDGVAIAGAADSSTTVKGITKMSVAPASATSPIAVGDNDTRVPTQAENDALVGTSGTPSSTNKFVTDADTRFAGVFGGDGSDGALSVTSGTTTIDLSTKVLWQYSSISVSSGATLTFTGGTAGGKIPTFKCQGNFSNAGTITTQGLGVAGGAAGAVNTNGSNGNQPTLTFVDGTLPQGGFAGTNGNSTALGGAVALKNAGYFYPYALNGASGAGGSGGTAANVGTPGAGGAGGAGSLGVYIEVLGNYSNTGTINLKGVNGTNGVVGSGNGSASWASGGGGGGGGGGAGSLVVRYKGTFTNSGSTLVTGGTAGAAGGNNSVGAGGGTIVYGGGGGGGAGGATSFNSTLVGGTGQTVASNLSLPGGGAGSAGGDGIYYFDNVK